MKYLSDCLSEEHIDKLKNQILFSGLSEHEIFMFVQFSRPLYKYLKIGESITLDNDFTRMLGLVFSGKTCIQKIDYNGNKSVLKLMNSNEISAFLYSMFTYQNSVIELIAREDSEVLLIKPEYLFITEEKLATIQHKILVNLIASQRESILDISEHIACLSQRTIKGKVLKLLSMKSTFMHNSEVNLPFSREELANYLAVDRAALSRALSELKKEGIIDFHKSRFKLLQSTNSYE